jgi:hypothetical protein
LKDRRREVFEGFERDVSYLLLQLMNSHSNERWHPGP